MKNYIVPKKVFIQTVTPGFQPYYSEDKMPCFYSTTSCPLSVSANITTATYFYFIADTRLTVIVPFPNGLT